MRNGPFIAARNSKKTESVLSPDLRVPVYIPLFNGRWIVFNNGTWVGWHNQKGITAGNIYNSFGRESEPVPEWNQNGIPIPEGAILHNIFLQGRSATKYLQWIDLRCYFYHGERNTPNAWDSNSEMKQDVLVKQNNINWANDSHMVDLPVSDYLVPRKGGYFVMNLRKSSKNQDLKRRIKALTMSGWILASVPLKHPLIPTVGSQS